MSRVPAEQTWPECRNTPVSTWSTELSQSASAKTMCGFLPPSSTATLVTCSAAIREMVFPVAKPPVKEMKSTSSVSVRAAPSTAPLPCTRFTTPGGTPASSISRVKATVLSGVTSLGFRTIVQPAASAGATFQDICNSG